MPLDDYFPRALALSPNGGPVPNAEAVVYAASDTELTTPLAITDVDGLPLDKLVASPDGIYPQFKTVDGTYQVKIKSGDEPALEHVSLYWLVQAVGLDPDTVAEAIGSAASAAVQALAAAQSAQAAAASAAVLQELVDASGTPLIEDPDDPGTFLILNPAALSEDPSDPGTFLIGGPQ
jgi:hypothetical protein